MWAAARAMWSCCWPSVWVQVGRWWAWASIRPPWISPGRGREGDGHVIGFYPRVSTSWATATFGRTMTKAASVGLLLWDNGDGQGLLQQPGLTLAPGQVS